MQLQTPTSTPPDAPGARRAPKATATVAFVALLALVAIALPLWLAQHYGALSSPRSDDWSYLRTLFTWHSTGAWDFNNWVSMTLLGQVVLSAPVVSVFGEHLAALRFLVAGLGFVGLVAVARTGHAIGLPRTDGWFVALVVAAGPLWGALAGSYMTDVPAFAFGAVSLMLACRALAPERASMSLLTASVVAGVVAISIRQYAVVGVAAILVAAAWRFATERDRARLRAVIALGVATAITTGALLAWWATVPRGKGLTPDVPTFSSVQVALANGAGFVRLAGLMLLPVIVLANPVAIVRRAWRRDATIATWTALLTGLGLALGYLVKSQRPFVGNYFDRRGVLGDDIINGTRPLIFADAVFEVLVVVGSIGGVVLALAMVPFLADRMTDVRARRLPPVDAVTLVLCLTVAGFTVAYEVAIALGLPIFDRYALPVLPVAALALLRSVRRAAPEGAQQVVPEPDPRTRRGLVAATLAAYAGIAVLGVVYTAESASYDGTRWQVAEDVVALGWDPVEVHGGYEWVGWFRGDGPLTADTIAERKKLRAAYFEGLCVTVVINPTRLPERALAWAWSDAPSRRPVRVVAVRNDRECAVSETDPVAGGDARSAPVTPHG